MPNHVHNELYFEADNKERISELLNAIKGEDTAFDFNKIIPMPKELEIESGSRGEWGLKAYKEFLRTGVKPKEITDEWGHTRSVEDKDFELGKQYYNNIEKYGHATWYSWACDNWNTKWNAYDVEELVDGVVFLTAWDAPFPVIKALSEMFPDVRITHYFADEDLGYNCGKYSYIGGNVEDISEFEEGSDEALEFACDIWGYDYDVIIAERNE